MDEEVGVGVGPAERAHHAGADGPTPGHRRQRRPAIEQGVHQLRLVQRLQPMSSAPARSAKIAVAKLSTSVTTTIRMRA
jgi:hypothetical protein